MSERITRRDTERVKQWQPPTHAAEPIRQDGVTFRWVRESTMGESDLRNTQSKMTEGYVPVKADDPAVENMHNLEPNKGDGLVRRGGLMLMKIDSTLAKQRNQYYSDRANQQQRSAEESAVKSLRTRGQNPEAKLQRKKSFPKVSGAEASE